MGGCNCCLRAILSFGWSCDFVVTIKKSIYEPTLDWIKTCDLGFASSWGQHDAGWGYVIIAGRFFWDGVSSRGNAIGSFDPV